jgi:hypothetical protein
MSETTTATAGTEPTPTPKQVAEAASQGKPGESPEQTIAALREALSKANSEAKDNRLKASEFDKLQQERMSELERAQAATAEAQKAAEQAAAEALRWRIAAKHGISDDDAETFLTGTDEASLTRQAERLSAIAAVTPATPKPDLTQGGSGNPPALNSDGLEQALRNKLGI